WARNIRSTEHYFRAGLTWPRRTQSGLSLRAMPAGCVFADKGPAVFVENDASDSLLALLAVVNTRAFRALVEIQMAFGSYEVGVIQRTPIPPFSALDQSSLAALARRAWSLKRSLDTRTETSHAFTMPSLLRVAAETLAERADAWTRHVRAADSALVDIQADIDLACFDLYGIDEADRRAITEGLGIADPFVESAESDAETDAEADDENDVESTADAPHLVSEFVSWAV